MSMERGEGQGSAPGEDESGEGTVSQRRGPSGPITIALVVLVAIVIGWVLYQLL